MTRTKLTELLTQNRASASPKAEWAKKVRIRPLLADDCLLCGSFAPDVEVLGGDANAQLQPKLRHLVAALRIMSSRCARVLPPEADAF